jgi:hypothetical protein
MIELALLSTANDDEDSMAVLLPRFFHKLLPWMTTMMVLFSTSTHAAPAADPSADLIVRAARQVIQQVDAGQYESVWKSTPDFVHEALGKERFVDGIKTARTRIAAPVASRHWSSVSRMQHNAPGNPALPVGLYANVIFDTTLDGAQAFTEQVSFYKKEANGRWQPIGYVVKDRHQ